MNPVHRSICLQIMFTREELKVIDDWRSEYLMPSRAAALRELMRAGSQRGHSTMSWSSQGEEGQKMTSKRQEAERQFQRLSRQEKDERTTSKSRSITDADKTTRDLKTAGLKKLREAREAETALKKGKR
jgi:hypothetical protein